MVKCISTKLDPFPGGEDVTRFIESFEKLTLVWDDQTRKEVLGQYLQGDALNWLRGIEGPVRRETTRDERGNTVTRWQALQWKALRSRLEKDFDGLEQRSIFSRKQREGESNASYLYDLLARIALSDSCLSEKAKIELIKSGLQPKVMWYLEDKKVATLEDLDF